MQLCVASTAKGGIIVYTRL